MSDLDWKTKSYICVGGGQTFFTAFAHCEDSVMMYRMQTDRLQNKQAT